jgi:hypothetical protein
MDPASDACTVPVRPPAFHWIQRTCRPALARLGHALAEYSSQCPLAPHFRFRLLIVIVTMDVTEVPYLPK